MKNPMKHIVATLIVLAFLSLQVFGQSALERVRKRGSLIIGTSASYPPFEQHEGEKYEGFDIDLGNAIARELGVRAEFVNSSFAGIIPSLQNGNFDIVMSAMTITPERSKHVLFTDPYVTAGQMIAVRQETLGIEKPEDLQGKRVGVELGSTAQAYFRGRMEVDTYDEISIALTDLHLKRLDAVVSDAPVLRWMTSQSESFRELKTVGQRFTDEKLGIAVAQGSDDLRLAINAALLRLIDKREYDRIYQQWLADSGTTSSHTVVGPAKANLFDPGLVRRTWPLFLKGVWLTGRVAFLSLLLGLPLGLFLALARVQSLKVLSAPAAVYVEIVRGTPLLVQILFIYLVLPNFGITLPRFPAGVAALALNGAAYISEIFRAGILSIEAGQMEAARSLGMTYAQAMRRIILPQTFRRVIPPLTNEGIALLKDSSLVSVIGLVELTKTGQDLASRFAAPLTMWPVVAIFYLMLTFPLTRVSQYLERHWRPA
ncbi:MAG: arginine/lysine/histidine/glutamine transport system substrate-binding and permease protein [Blastocatellia bacterium]|jgi:His/Glu/Gln/Arg/opine family amino acid ABC transporter permease subunit|nr:arginine/lysine/histidine/glutamine transport system substrate-binding and permease protein [Blastocatellia bacterium]